MTEKQIAKLANVQKKIEELLDNNKSGKIVLYIREDGTMKAEIVEEI